ncbi:DNA polymerase III subunit beta [Candidatus Saccharibacteria bacterium]|nr:DNA polymerase III subunit beta [Candidatus Saccharibacteria bacterium]
MKVTILQENLLPKLSAVSRFASSRAALPVLENILLTAERGVLTLSATDLDTGVRTSVGAKVERGGSTTVPARLLVGLIGNLPPGRLILSSQKDILTVEAEDFASKINGLSSEEFPAFVEEGKKAFAIDAKTFREAITQVSFAAAQDESRPILTGLLLRLDGGILTLVGVDGFRLAEKRIKIEGTDMSVVVPSRSFAEVSKLMSGEVEVLQSEGGQLIFKSEDFTVFAQALEGEFPEYEQIIPSNFETKITFSKDELSKAVQLTSIFSEVGTGIISLDYDPKGKKLEASSQESESGEARQMVAISGEGKRGTISFNSRYLTDALNALGSEEIVLSLNSSVDPVLFSVPKDKTYIHVVMPVRLQG